MEKEKDGLLGFLMEHAEKKAVSFHMPGHKGSQLYQNSGYEDFLHSMMDCDITEIQGADNLFQTEGILKTAMERYAQLYEVRKSYLLINGTSCGLISAILSTVTPGGKLILARNCHKSVFNALTLGNISPVYAYPELISQFGISGQVTAAEIQRLVAENPDAEAVILPSPNYYGICSPIEEISAIVHKAGKILIVDQAHGAHLKFFNKYEKEQGEGAERLPKGAEECGADIVVNSIHKTLASFTQSAVLNVVTDKVDLWALEDKLQTMESTSPSYLLMASLDINGELLEREGGRLIQNWHQNLSNFYQECRNIDGLRLVHTGDNMDWTKINLDMSQCGLSGYELEQLLIRKNIYIELVTGDIAMCMTGIGNEKSDYDNLLKALQEISLQYFGKGKVQMIQEREGTSSSAISLSSQREMRSVPVKKVAVPLEEATGRVCAGSIIPYPPGIPLICPGEIISGQAAAYVTALRKNGHKVMGVTEHNEVIVGV